MAPPKRVRYNAKARASSAGGPLKKKRKVDMGADDTNVVVIDPGDQKARKEVLLNEMKGSTQSTSISSKKRKRMEKYIDKKLMQEERQNLFAKISVSQNETSSLFLQSSAMLGTGDTESHAHLKDRGEDLEVKRMIRRRRRRGGLSPSPEESETGEEDDSAAISKTEKIQSGSLKQRTASPSLRRSSATEAPGSPKAIPDTRIGAALLHDSSGQIVQSYTAKRKKKLKKNRWGISIPQSKAPDSDTSFDSAFGSSDEDEEGTPLPGAETAGDNSYSAPAPGDVTMENHASSSSEPPPMDIDESTIDEHPKKTFKDWARNQLDIARGYTAIDDIPSTKPDASEEKVSLSQDSLHNTNILPASSHTLPASVKGPLGIISPVLYNSTAFSKAVLDNLSRRPLSPLPPVIRRPKIQEARLQLPILAEEQMIVENILLNPVVIIQGETGSGKTSQVVQFLWEAGFGRREIDENVAAGLTGEGIGFEGTIGITQPRRVAAMSMAARVAEELLPPSESLPTSSRTVQNLSVVGYQIRYAATVSSTTRIKFMTEGILLRELSADFLLRKYCVLIIDEAHERSLSCDVLLGCLTRVARLREDMWRKGKDGIKPLRLVIMSASLSVSALTENASLFPSKNPPPPILTVPSRQHSLTVHFSRKTSSDYVGEALKKVVKIHKKLPSGGILVFLTGQREIEGVCRRLRSEWSKDALDNKMRRHNSRSDKRAGFNEDDSAVETSAVSARIADIETEDIVLGTSADSAIDDERKNEINDSSTLDLDALETEDDQSDSDIGPSDEFRDPMHVVPLYSLLPPDRQLQVFQDPPFGSRLVVVATNVAETSITIPGIRYVVDCGRARERQYDASTGIQSFPVSWISKASAQQRAGRAGRTGPGHVYRLYSSAVYENFFSEQTEPEIMRMPIEGVVLTMKAMEIDVVVNFPFPTPPDRSRLSKAENVLRHLGALAGDSGMEGHITDLGRAMTMFPLSPRYAKMLVAGRQHGCLPYIIAIVSALSVGDPFLSDDTLFSDRSKTSEDDTGLGNTAPNAEDDDDRSRTKKAYYESQYKHSSLGNHTSDPFKYLSVVGAFEFAGGGHDFCTQHFVRYKAMEDIHKLRAQIHDIVHINFPDDRCEFSPKLRPPSKLQVLRQLITSGFIDQIAVRKDLVERSSASGKQYTTCRKVPYRALGVSEDVYVHPASVVFQQSPPSYIAFQDVVRGNKVHIKTLTVVNPFWLSALGPSLCTFSSVKVVKNTKGLRTDTQVVIPHFGPEGWELPAIEKPPKSTS